jgi:hypothetical protein
VGSVGFVVRLLLRFVQCWSQKVDFILGNTYGVRQDMTGDVSGEGECGRGRVGGICLVVRGLGVWVVAWWRRHIGETVVSVCG